MQRLQSQARRSISRKPAGYIIPYVTESGHRQLQGDTIDDARERC